MVNLYATKKWRKLRGELIEGKTCEWCGSTEKLAPHHKNPKPIGLRSYRIIANKYYNEYFENKKNKSELAQIKKEAKIYIKNNAIRTCPNCKKKSFYERKTMAPTYRCTNCGTEFNEPYETYNISKKNILSKTKYLFLIKHKDEMNRKYRDYASSARDHYLDISKNDFMILCKKCHFALEKGMVLCKKCGKKYHSPRYQVCFNCYISLNDSKDTLAKPESTNVVYE
jgi:ribosomal protein L37AE/L43A